MPKYTPFSNCRLIYARALLILSQIVDILAYILVLFPAG